VSDRHATVYLASRGASALINAAAVAVFTRLTSPALYGQYLIGFAVCFIVYSLSVQWASYAHFGNYERGRADRLAGSLLVISGLATLPALAVLGALAWFGALIPDIAWACAVVLICFTLFFAANEIGRTHLMVTMVTAASLTRSVGSLLFGAAGVIYFQNAAALLLGVGLGYALGALPILFSLRSTIWRQGFVGPTRQDVMAILSYGWPLIVAFGAAAAAMNIDRILLERLSSAAAVAPYGAVLDFMRQTFLVVAEAISVAYVSNARTLLTDGDAAGANDLLRRAFVTQTYIMIFGTAFFVLLGPTLFGVLLPASYLPVVFEILPILVVANILLVLRTYHFGQVIYLGASTKIEFAACLTMLVVAAGASALLIPLYGPVGAAIAFALSQGAALLVYLVATPVAMRLPVDWMRAGVLVLCGAALMICGEAFGALLPHLLAVALDLALLTLACSYFLIHWNLFDAKVIVQRLYARFSAQVTEL
jgi:O-antigen/teichoic acid export membrane protein